MFKYSFTIDTDNNATMYKWQLPIKNTCKITDFSVDFQIIAHIFCRIVIKSGRFLYVYVAGVSSGVMVSRTSVSRAPFFFSTVKA